MNRRKHPATASRTPNEGSHGTTNAEGGALVSEEDAMGRLLAWPQRMRTS
jgi:hypothetical protein